MVDFRIGCIVGSVVPLAVGLLVHALWGDPGAGYLGGCLGVLIAGGMSLLGDLK